MRIVLGQFSPDIIEGLIVTLAVDAVGVKLTAREQKETSS